MDKDFVKLKLRRDPALEDLDLYEFKIALFDNGKPEDFLLFVRNFNMALEDLGTLNMSAKAQYLNTIFHGEALRQFDSLSDYVKSANPLT